MSKKNEPRMVAWVDPTMLVEGEGYRVSIVREGEAGHHPTGDWPFKGKPGQRRPWFWGPTLADAEKACAAYNKRLGVDEETAFKIVAESMALQNTRGRHNKRK